MVCGFACHPECCFPIQKRKDLQKEIKRPYFWYVCFACQEKHPNVCEKTTRNRKEYLIYKGDLVFLNDFVFNPIDLVVEQDESDLDPQFYNEGVPEETLDPLFENQRRKISALLAKELENKENHLNRFHQQIRARREELRPKAAEFKSTQESNDAKQADNFSDASVQQTPEKKISSDPETPFTDASSEFQYGSVVGSPTPVKDGRNKNPDYATPDGKQSGKVDAEDEPSINANEENVNSDGVDNSQDELQGKEDELYGTLDPTKEKFPFIETKYHDLDPGQVLEELGYKPIDVRGDGNCGYYALLLGIYNLEKQSILGKCKNHKQEVMHLRRNFQKTSDELKKFNFFDKKHKDWFAHLTMASSPDNDLLKEAQASFHNKEEYKQANYFKDDFQDNILCHLDAMWGFLVASVYLANAIREPIMLCLIIWNYIAKKETKESATTWSTRVIRMHPIENLRQPNIINSPVSFYNKGIKRMAPAYLENFKTIEILYTTGYQFKDDTKEEVVPADNHYAFLKRHNFNSSEQSKDRKLSALKQVDAGEEPSNNANKENNVNADDEDNSKKRVPDDGNDNNGKEEGGSGSGSGQPPRGNDADGGDDNDDEDDDKKKKKSGNDNASEEEEEEDQEEKKKEKDEDDLSHTSTSTESDASPAGPTTRGKQSNKEKSPAKSTRSQNKIEENINVVSDKLDAAKSKKKPPKQSLKQKKKDLKAKEGMSWQQKLNRSTKVAWSDEPKQFELALRKKRYKELGERYKNAATEEKARKKREADEAAETETSGAAKRSRVESTEDEGKPKSKRKQEDSKEADTHEDQENQGDQENRSKKAKTIQEELGTVPGDNMPLPVNLFGSPETNELHEPSQDNQAEAVDDHAIWVPAASRTTNLATAETSLVHHDYRRNEAIVEENLNEVYNNFKIVLQLLKTKQYPKNEVILMGKTIPKIEHATQAGEVVFYETNVEHTAMMNTIYNNKRHRYC